MSEILVRVDNVSKSYRLPNGGSVDAVKNVSFDLKKGKTLGLVGSSGCGKTTVCHMVAGVCMPDSGSILLEGIEKLSRNKTVLNGGIQLVFQNPMSSLNPAFTVRRILKDYYIINNIRLNQNELDKKLERFLEMVHLEIKCLDKYPHELSVGQCQRVCIARALESSPKVIICDEITASMDVSVQARIINMMLELQQETGVSYLFVSHDIDLVRHMADDIAIMNSGEIVEYAEAFKIYQESSHFCACTMF